MTSFTFSAEQVKAAPPEVRRWMENEIVKALAGEARPAREASESLEALAAGTPEELQAVFARVASNSIVARVFFELARDSSFMPGPAPFHGVAVADVIRHVQLSDARQLLACLDMINQAFQKVRNDPQASLFALDEAGHIYLHDMTYRSIRQVWQQLVVAHPWPATGHMAQAPDIGQSGGSPKGAPESSQGGERAQRHDPQEPFMRPEHAFAGTSTD